jgi:SAM-dependent methyltransferase
MLPAGHESLIRCPICGDNELVAVLSGNDNMHHFPGRWSVIRCGRCLQMFTSPRPDRDHIGSYYPADYIPHADLAAVCTPSRWKIAAKALYRLLLDPRELVVPPHVRPGRLLEVGCGSGQTLVALQRAGWDVLGLEPSTTVVEALRQRLGLNVLAGVIAETDFPESHFRLVVAQMVLEHLHDPLADVRRIHGWLEPGGYLTGSVPNCASWEFRHFGGEWLGLHLPNHLFHFTPATLTQLLHAAGFRDVRVYHQRNVNNLSLQLGHWLQARAWPLADLCLRYPAEGPWYLRLALRPIGTLLAWVRQAGRISFVARR